MTQQTQNATYAQWWTIFQGMPPEHRKTMWVQLLNKISGVTMQGVIEALEDAPERAKIDAWAHWSKTHDLTGYVLKQIEALKDTEPASAVEQMMRKWVAQADLKAYRMEDVFKMADRLPSLDDVDALWLRWGKQSDLRKYEIELFCKVISKIAPSVSVKLISEWISQNGAEAIASIRTEKLTRIKNMGLPTRARDMINAALKSGETVAKYKEGDAIKIVGHPYSTRVEGVFQFNGAWKYRLKDEMRYFDEAELVGI